MDPNARRPYRWFALFSLFSLFVPLDFATDEHRDLWYLSSLSFLSFLVFLLPARVSEAHGRSDPR